MARHARCDVSDYKPLNGVLIRIVQFDDGEKPTKRDREPANQRDGACTPSVRSLANVATGRPAWRASDSSCRFSAGVR
jgi:hypothetical protein